VVNQREAPPGQWGVYMVRCADGTLYTGATCDLERRVATHNRGRGAAYTRARLPVVAVFWEPAEDKRAALSREWHLKQLPRADKLLLVQRTSPARRRTGPRAAPRGRTAVRSARPTPVGGTRTRGKEAGGAKAGGAKAGGAKAGGAKAQGKKGRAATPTVVPARAPTGVVQAAGTPRTRPRRRTPEPPQPPGDVRGQR
jgi:putative endonuclease